MIIIAGILIGAGLGLSNARRRGGTGLDQLQYAAVGTIIGALLGIVVTIAIERML